MQNRPNHVQTCTQARRRIVSGMDRMHSQISRTAIARPAFSVFMRRKPSRSSGGCSRVLTTVQSTAPRKATAPT
jgi:hypothetical protein